MHSMTTKQIRESRATHEQICLFKFGLALTPLESTNWLYRLKKLTSVKHQNILLRIAHGEIYTKEKLCRYGLIELPTCPRCDQVETLRHKFIECEYIARIWTEFNVKMGLTDNEDPINRIMGAYRNCNRAILTVTAETLLRIFQLKSDQTYLLRPKLFIKLIIQHLQKVESHLETKDLLKTITI